MRSTVRWQSMLTLASMFGLVLALVAADCEHIVGATRRRGELPGIQRSLLTIRGRNG